MKNYNEEYFKKLEQKFLSDPYIYIDPDKSCFQVYIQNGPVEEYGKNGTQIEVIGKIWLDLLQQFNLKFPCRENSISITKIEEALMWQQKRTDDRMKRKVEGFDLS